MRANSLIPTSTFLTKFLNADLQLARDFPCRASLLPANFVEYDNLLRATRERCEVLIIDPVTHAFSYRGYLDKPTFTRLPYAPGAPLDAATLRDQGRLRAFTERVLQHEVEVGADVLVAPYLYIRDLDDGRLAISNRMIAEALRFPREHRPLHGMVCVAATVLESPVQTNDLVRQYREPDVDGYLVMVENFDDRKVSAEILMGMGRLVQGLSRDRDVVICSIASYGQVMTALCANGFSAGVGWLETFRESNLQPGRVGFPGDRAHRSQFYYVPELLSYLPPDAVPVVFGADGSDTAREYLCQCQVCREGIPELPQDKKRHFMYRRHQEMEELAAVPPGDRLEYMRNRLGLALELAAAIEEEALVLVPTEHFIRWIAVIDAFSGPDGAPREPVPLAEDLHQAIEEGRRTRNGG